MRAPLLIALLIACGGPPKGHGPQGEDRPDQSDPRVLVEAHQVAIGDVADQLVTTGVLESEMQADIVPEASGVVTDIRVEEGDVVAAGDVLAIISNPSLDAGAQRANIEFSQARSAFAEAQALHAQGAVSEKDLRDARAALQTARASLSEASRSRGFTRVTSPIGGTVAVRDLRVGEVAGAARAFQIVDLDHLRIIIQLPEKDLSRVAVGQVAELSSAYDDEATVPGHVVRVSPVVDAANGTVRVTVGVDPGQQSLRPGQFVRVRLQLDVHEGITILPRKAIVWTDGEPIAWVIVDDEEEDKEDDKEDEEAEDDGPGFFAKLFASDEDEEEDEEADPWDGVPRRTIEKARLELGYTDARHAEILSGLEPGQPVVIVGNQRLRLGAKIRLPDDPMPDWPDEDEDEDAEDEDAEGGATEG